MPKGNNKGERDDAMIYPSAIGVSPTEQRPASPNLWRQDADWPGARMVLGSPGFPINSQENQLDGSVQPAQPGELKSMDGVPISQGTVPPVAPVVRQPPSNSTGNAVPDAVAVSGIMRRQSEYVPSQSEPDGGSIEYLKNLLTTPAQEEKLRKDAQSRARIFALADAIRQIGNIYNTSRYAPSQQFNDPLSQVRQDYLQGRSEREANNYRYYKAMMDRNAADAERLYKDALLKMKSRESDANVLFKEAQTRGQEAKTNKTNIEADYIPKRYDLDKWKAEQAVETAKKNAEAHILSAHASALNARTNREKFDAEKAAGKYKSDVEKNQNTVRLNDGSVHKYDKKLRGAISSLAPQMIKKAKAAAQRYREAGMSASNLDERKRNKILEEHYSLVAAELEKAGSENDIASIVASNVGDFPTMDGDIRHILNYKDMTMPGVGGLTMPGVR